MLQWMGGSRRKVTASRRSTEKRQKQYFEQRRRQHQHEDGLTEDNADATVTNIRQKGKRSLDILSFLNVSNATEECGAQCGNVTNQVADNTSTIANKATYLRTAGASTAIDHHSPSRAPTVTNDEIFPTECPERTVKRSGTPSSHDMGAKSPCSTLKNTSEVRNTATQFKKNDSIIPQELSILDLVVDDDASRKSDGHFTPEAHVSFSIEGLTAGLISNNNLTISGLGKLGTETPPQSPQQHRRMLPGDQSLSSKAAKKLRSCKNFDSMMEDFRVESDTEIPSRSDSIDSFRMQDMRNQVGKVHGVSTVKDTMQLDGKRYDIYDEDSLNDLWSAKTPFFDDDGLDEKCTLNQKDGYAAYHSYFPINVSPDFEFERHQEEMTDEFNILDERDCKFPSLENAKYSSFTSNYRPSANCTSPFQMTLDDNRDSLTSLSEESCSSTAVRGEGGADVHRRKVSKDQQMPFKSSLRENYDEVLNGMASTISRGENFGGSRIQKRANSSRSKTGYPSHSTRNGKLANEELWPLEEELPFCNGDMHSGSFLRSSHQTKMWGKNVSEEADLLHASKCSVDSCQRDIPDDFFMKSHVFDQPFGSRPSFNTSPISKAGGESWLGVHHDLEIHVQSSNTSEVADFVGETEPTFPISDLSAGSATEGVVEKPKIQPLQPRKEVRDSTGDEQAIPKKRFPTGPSNSVDYDGSPCVPTSEISLPYPSKGVEETSWSTRIPFKLDRRFQGSFLALHQQKLKDKDIADDVEGPKTKSISMEQPCQVMLVERYVQLMCMARGNTIQLDATNKLL